MHPPAVAVARELANGQRASPPPLTLIGTRLLDASGDRPLHARLRRALRTIIEEHFADGQKFYTEPQLIEHLHLSQSTVRRALLDLTRDGLLDRRVAKGSFVRKPTLAQGSAFTVHVFLPEWNSEFLMGMLEALARHCKQAGYLFRVHYTHQRERSDEAWRAVEGGPDRDGVILFSNPTHATLDLFHCFHDRHYRVVNIDCLIPGYPGSFVGTSNADVMCLGLDHLQSLGHQRIVFFINEPEEHGNVIERTQIFEREAATRGLAGARVFHCGTHFFEDSHAVAYQRMADLMADGQERPTALFTMSDLGAWAAVKWCADRGISVPGELSVLGFGDDRPSRFIHPALTTIAHPIDELAGSALDLLIRPRPKRESRLIHPTLIVRESTGPAPQRV